ncbi:MAG: ATPase, T2SS/T4P/T4SS family, partial [Eubacteriales bacterium]|nr:ATPase, T2SS/T4P/T4SS family [Eubacteriales bacterium]
MNHIRLGDLLINAGLITHEQLHQALEKQKLTRERLGHVLISEKVISEAQLIRAIEMQLGVEFIDLSTTRIDSEMAGLISKNLAKKHGVLPVRKSMDTLYLAMEDPLNFPAIEEVKIATMLKVVPMISTEDAIERGIETLYGNVGAARAIEEMKRDADIRDDDTTPGFVSTTLGEQDLHSGPTIRLVNSILERAIAEQASDIHLEPRENELFVRMRVDGMLRNILTVPKNLQPSVIARLKVIASMDIAERKVP